MGDLYRPGASFFAFSSSFGKAIMSHLQCYDIDYTGGLMEVSNFCMHKNNCRLALLAVIIYVVIGVSSDGVFIEKIIGKLAQACMGLSCPCAHASIASTR